MDKSHSRIIIILLAVIAAVLLFGRDATLGSMQTFFWIALACGVVWLVVWVVIALIRYIGRESRAYRDEVSRDRKAGKPWLHTFVAWPGIIGNFAVLGVAAYWRFVEESCRSAMGDCINAIPLWWLPVALLLGSIPIMAAENLIERFRNRQRID